MQRCADVAEQRITFLLEEEQEPFTMNEHYFMDYRSKFLGHYKGIRLKAESSFIDKLQNEEYKLLLSKATSSLAALGFPNVDASTLPRLLPPDPMECAIEIMAEVRAYFQGSERSPFFLV
jgi:hypothetical protein